MWSSGRCDAEEESSGEAPGQEEVVRGEIHEPLEVATASHLELILDAVGHSGGISAHLRNPVRLDLLPGKQIYKCPNLVPVDLDVALVMRDLQEDQAATNRCRRHLSNLK